MYIINIQNDWLNPKGLARCLINHNGDASEALIKNKFTFFLVIRVETEYGTQY